MDITSFTEMDFDSWVDKYRPIKDKFEDGPRQFETYGADWDIIRNTDPRYIWTWIDGGDYSLIINGVGLVNRLVYYITEVPWEDGQVIQIDMYQPDECEEAGHVFEKVERYDGKEYDCCKYCGEDREAIEEYA